MNDRIIPRLAAFILAALLLFTFTLAGCGLLKPPALSLNTLRFEGEIREHVSAVRDPSLHFIDGERLGNPMTSSGLMRLYLDDNSFGVALFETSKEQMWYSLPIAADEDDSQDGDQDDNDDAYTPAPVAAGHGGSPAAIARLDIVCGRDVYRVNSQDDAVAYGNVAVDVTGSMEVTGFDVKYVITVDEATAKSVDRDKLADGELSERDFKKTDIVFLVTVSYRLRDGNLYISAAWENLSGNGNAFIENLGLFEFFGANTEAKDGDFILVPDGCGAVIYTAVPDPNFKPLRFAVYGGDVVNPGRQATLPAIFPAFGAKRGNNAFIIIIESGDAIATISADRATGESGLNMVGASFNITETKITGEKAHTVRTVNTESSVDEVRLCVRLLGGGSANYDGMAAACREQFMRNRLISTNIVRNEEYLPFNLSLVGASTGFSSLIQKIETTKTLTTFEQARDILARMKAKGINNVNIRFRGALSGGVNQNEIGKLSPSWSLGGKKGFGQLSEYAAAQGHSLFLDVSALSWSGDSVTSNKAAHAISGENAGVNMPNPTQDITKVSKLKRNLLGFSGLENVVIKLLTDAKKLSFDGFCLEDAARLLYSDYSNGYTSRQSAAAIVAENAAALSTGRDMMLDTGNFYAIKNADVIVNLPVVAAAGERKGYYEAVPFVQMILHGTVDYSGRPINLSADPSKTMLRFVEYGACPSYEWTFDSSSEKFYYETWLQDAVQFYQKASEALSSLRNTRITDNYETAERNVYCTEYDGGAVIYVNYNGEAAEVDGIIVAANSFIRIN
ncbi:MAG: DUF5696 domain-containing protein [Oscillospiraceae bacterium]|nr:DUF5696 domain-containing protein [Oscillospiraceae bacterium]